ncbi:MAG TPA: DJ-1/PfpI family protein, partial [Myxococcaceae bacterium]|nr:DJ-1/PfpI family protein [Myxococcaceae bacterium]
MSKTSSLLGCVLALAVAPTADAAEASRPAPKPTTRNVAIVLYEGVELLDFAGPGEVFAAAARFGALRGQPAFRVYTVAKSKGPITSQGFLKVTPDYTIDNAPRADLIVLPGGNSGTLFEDPRFIDWARKAIDGAELSMSVCTGAFVLGKAGALDGRTATTWFGATEKLRQTFPKTTVQDGRRFVDEGRIVTTAGVSAGIDGALHVVARLLGRVVADKTARYMEYHWAPEAYLAQKYSLLNPSIDDRGRAFQRAGMLEDEKNWSEAANAYRALADEEPEDGYAWHRLAVALYHAGDAQAAVSAGKKAAGFLEVRSDALVSLACMYARAGRRNDALAALEE